MVDTNNNSSTENNTENNTEESNTNTSGTCVYDEYGRSPDKKVICGIGLPSASADEGSGFTKSTFENKCPHCGNATLRWGWNWQDDPEKVSIFQGADGHVEGHFYCIQADGGCDADYSAQGNEHIDGSTYNMTRLSGPEASTKEEAQKLVDGQLACDGSSLPSSGEVVGGTAVNIQDVTFYGLIKQMIGGIDGLFIIANNMAYLLSFKDMYKYRDNFDIYIPEIKASDIIVDSLVKNWSTSGYYNSVEVSYKDGIVKYQNDALVKQYGENVFYYDFPEDDEETAKSKADALLAAHIRDYSTDIELNILYKERITEGSWVKLPKSVTKITSQTKKDREQEALKKQGKPIVTKHKGVNITNITEELVKQEDNSYKKIQHLTDEEENTFDIELEDNDYELFFVQGFTCRWNKKKSLMMSLHLKYGPDTPQDPINATISMGTVASTTGTSGGAGQWGDDCFSICDICIQNCDKILPYGGGRRQDAEEYIRKNEADSSYLTGRAKQDSTYAKEVSGKTPQEAYTLFRSKFNYACYSDSCDSSYPCCEDLWTKATAANCGDSTRMLKVLMDATGTPCYGIHVDGHYFNAVQVDGTWHTLDGTRGPTNSSCNFPDSGNYGAGSNACGSGWC